jgi:hypothetical protein
MMGTVRPLSAEQNRNIMEDAIIHEQEVITDALETIFDYLCNEEQKHFYENDEPAGHIYRSVLILGDYLQHAREADEKRIAA